MAHDGKKARELYPGQPHDEVTQRVIYKHIMSIIPFIFAVFVLGLAGIVMVYWLGVNQESIESSIPPFIISMAGFIFIAILAFLFLGVIWIWKRNKIVITDKHIVDIDQMGLFNRTVSTLRLEEIQDISASIKGPVQTIFRYGTINIQTAGERPNFLFDYVPDPYQLEHYILEIRKQYYETDVEEL